MSISGTGCILRVHGNDRVTLFVRKRLLMKIVDSGLTIITSKNVERFIDDGGGVKGSLTGGDSSSGFDEDPSYGNSGAVE